MNEEIQQKYDADIWRQIKQEIINHCEFDVDPDDIHPHTRTADLFPPKTSRNRFGEMMFDMFRFVNRHCQLQLTIDYPRRSEYVYFTTLSTIWIYFLERIEEEIEIEAYEKEHEKKEAESSNPKIIPFPKNMR